MLAVIHFFMEFQPMSVMAEFSVVPIGKGVSLSHEIARVLKIVAKSGVRYLSLIHI